MPFTTRSRLMALPTIVLAGVIVPLMSSTASGNTPVVASQVSFATAAAQALGNDEYDISFFYQELAPYGEWVPHERYGWVWTPYDVPLSWRPYSDGRWIYTDYGWTWMSNEQWGWATYHFGRWFFDNNWGWMWVPASEWAPAWVMWRIGDDWIGWAPLPPEANVWQQDQFVVGEWEPAPVRRHAWNFLPLRYFLEQNVSQHIVHPAQNINIVRITEPVVRFSRRNNIVINRGIGRTRIERVINRPVTVYRIEERPFHGHRHGGRARDTGHGGFVRGIELQGDRVIAYRPRLREGRPSRTPREIIVDRGGGSRQDTSRNLLGLVEEGARVLSQRQSQTRSNFDQRIQRERQQPPRYVQRNDMDRWYNRERGALDEQSQREQRLLNFYRDRLKKGEAPATAAKVTKYKTSQTQQREVRKPADNDD